MDLESLSPEFRRALLETIPCALVVLDNDGRILYWNRAAAEITGYRAEEVAGATCEMMQVRLSGEQDPRTLHSLCPSPGSAWDQECEIRAKDGRIVPIVRIARTVRDEAGEPSGTIQAMVDISAVREARDQIRTLQQEVARSGRFGELVGNSPPMRQLYEAMDMIAATDASVVIEGPTGTGKELVARTLHRRGRRAEAPFLPVNCGALPDSLLEPELFGHVRGAFTGAVSDRPGRFEQADGGTLLLDEVSELSPAAQVKLLRAIQEGEITRVGETRPRKVNVRILAATNKDLAAESAAGRFREDLFYRLRVVHLRVPPLRQRREDIPELAEHFIARFNAKYDRHVQRITPEAMNALLSHDWPGNVRQFEHAIEHAFVVSPPRARAIGPDGLPPEIAGRRQDVSPLAAGRDPREADEKSQVLAALETSGGNKSAAARLLGITRAGLYKKLRRLGITTRNQS